MLVESKSPFPNISADKILDRILSEFKKIGKANIIVVGKTGVGKSSLINAVFRGDFAKTGVGKPVTQGIQVITKKGVPLQIIDTQGLEVKDYDTIKEEITKYVNEKNSSEDADDYVNLAWLCISSTGKRIEDGEIEIAKTFNDLNIPLICVLTKVDSFKETDFKKEVEKSIGQYCKTICLVRSIKVDVYNDDDEVIGTNKPKGIDELIEESFRYIPDSKKSAFSNALSIKNAKSLDIKKREAEKAINLAAAAAMTAALSPIPFSDAAMIIPIQVTMIVKISSAYGLNITSNVISSLIMSIVGSTITTSLGRTIVSNVIKLIPGFGSVVGGFISSATAGALTKALGNTYSSILYTLSSNNESGDIDFNDAVSQLKNKYDIK